MTHLTDAQKQALPAAILRLAARTQRPDDCMALYYLTRHGGHSIASAARELDVPYRTGVNWSKAMDEAGDQVQSASDVEQALRELSAEDVALERRRLYEEAKAHGKLDLQQRLLADEAKRHGLEVQRVEQTSLVVQLQQLTPEARAAEIAERMQRLSLASTPGGSPPTGALHQVLDAPNPYAPILENDANASLPTVGDSGGGAPSIARTNGGSGGEVRRARENDANDASSVSDTSDTAAQEDPSGNSQ